jgi:hypothetical protein
MVVVHYRATRRLALLPSLCYHQKMNALSDIEAFLDLLNIAQFLSGDIPFWSRAIILAGLMVSPSWLLSQMDWQLFQFSNMLNYVSYSAAGGCLISEGVLILMFSHLVLSGFLGFLLDPIAYFIIFYGILFVAIDRIPLLDNMFGH